MTAPGGAARRPRGRRAAPPPLRPARRSPPSRAAPSPGSRESIEIGSTPPPPSRAAPAGAARPGGDDDHRDAARRRSAATRSACCRPSATGFARALWGPDGAAARCATACSTAARQRRARGAGALPPAAPRRGRPAARRRPGGSSVLVARIDRLLEMGALEEARRAHRPRRARDAPSSSAAGSTSGSCSTSGRPPCAALRQNPALSPTLPARVFCLARGGDWNAAEITLTLGEQVGSIPPDEQALLARFLDPELFEEEAAAAGPRAADRARLPDARGGRPAPAVRARCRSRSCTPTSTSTRRCGAASTPPSG